MAHPITDDDLRRFAGGTHARAYELFGAHASEHGTRFAVWAPGASEVSVAGEWSGFEPERLERRAGVWEGLSRAAKIGARYVYRVRGANGRLESKIDPYGLAHVLPPESASVVADLSYAWGDGEWMRARASLRGAPMSVYEVHVGSWCTEGDDHRPLGYRELAPRLAEHARALGFTHVELLPVMEHPFGGSFGYQLTGYFAPTRRWGAPEDLMFLIDHLHQQGIGVILDWAPAYFASDAHALASFDGTACYEHADPKRAAHAGSGGLRFDLGKPEVRSFLLSSATFWLERYHADGLRVNGVSSMLYLDHERSADGVSFVRQLNDALHASHPDALIVAEESTSWPMVSRPTMSSGLGFDAKWDTGWMHDILRYLERDPSLRRFHHNEITFRSLYAFHERFVLPLSHDEVARGKGSLLNRMPGDRWRKFANLRLLYAMMFSQPGKKLLFMGSEIAQWREWRHDVGLDWHLTDEPPHEGVRDLVIDLNRLYREERALHANDDAHHGFVWVDANDAERSVLSNLRAGGPGDRPILVVLNFTPTVRYDYRVGVPVAGHWEEILNTDAGPYGGSGVGNLGRASTSNVPAHGRACSLSITLPPLAAVWFRAPEPWSAT